MSPSELENLTEIDPRKPIVEVMARLGRETQFHLDERHRHFKITDAVIIGISIFLVVLAVMNIYFVRILYGDLEGIVANMENIYVNMKRVDDDMTAITANVIMLDEHMESMSTITRDTGHLADAMPAIRGSLTAMREDTTNMRVDMQRTREAMHGVRDKMHTVTGGMSNIRRSVREISRPMGVVAPFMP